MESYTTIEGVARATIVEKKSEFIASASFADSEEAALRFLESVRSEHRTANHNVYAYLLRQDSRTRYSDDGEPQKTAGLPVLEVLRHSGLTDLIVVVTRYFGGDAAGHRRAGARLHRRGAGGAGTGAPGHGAALRRSADPAALSPL